MGTRGFITFVVDGEEKTAYNHSDSYPQELGVDVLAWLRIASDSIDALRQRARELRVVGSESKPTSADIERLRKYADTGVAAGRVDDWYALLHETQGDPHKMLEAEVIEDAGDFPLDSLFAEWGYVIDLDTETFEVYKGFQAQPPDRGRFGRRVLAQADHGYYPVALAASWKFSQLPSDPAFLDAFRLPASANVTPTENQQAGA